MIEPDLLIVVGADLRAELEDRPLAYRLREVALERLSPVDSSDGPDARVLVCTDLWHLNHAHLRARPTISLGGPDRNALTAFLGDRIPSVLAVEGAYVVQMDLELVQTQCCCWGQEGPGTEVAVQAFIERYMDRFLECVGQGAGPARST